jgi:hypothetical protein
LEEEQAGNGERIELEHDSPIVHESIIGTSSICWRMQKDAGRNSSFPWVGTARRTVRGHRNATALPAEDLIQ